MFDFADERRRNNATDLDALAGMHLMRRVVLTSRFAACFGADALLVVELLLLLDERRNALHRCAFAHSLHCVFVVVVVVVILHARFLLQVVALLVVGIVILLIIFFLLIRIIVAIVVAIVVVVVVIIAVLLFLLLFCRCFITVR